jgi:hypothetical protein
VEDVCDRIAILVRGELKTCGSVRDLLLVRDTFQLRARGVRDDVGREVRDLLARQGATDVEVSHPRMTLESLFLHVIDEDQRRPSP